MTFAAKLSLGGGQFEDVTVSKYSTDGTAAGLVDVTLGNQPQPYNPPTPPPSPPAGAPNAPTGLKATLTSNTSLTLSWTAATVPTGSPAVTGYKVYTSQSVLLQTLGNVTSTQFTTLTAGTTYSYFVTALNSVGESAPSAVLTVTTTASTTVRRLGIYNGGPTTDDAVQTSFGSLPDIASTYYNLGSVSATNITNEKSRVNKGISPLLTATTSGTQYNYGIATGDATAIAKLDAYVDALRQISETNPNVPVYATLDHEFEVKVNQGTITGSSADEATYAKSLSIFFDKCKANAPKVKYGYWYGYFDTAAILTVLQNITTPPLWISLDPYTTASHPDTERPEGLIKPHTDWLRTGAASTQYKRLGSPAVAISETGIDVRHGDDNVGAWHTGLRQVMVDLDLLFLVFFDRTKVDANGTGVEYKIDTGAYPKGVAAYSASLASKVAG